MFSPKAWPGVSRKILDLSRRQKPYESGEYPHIISFRCVLVVNSKNGACLFKGRKRRNYYDLEEDATVE